MGTGNEGRTPSQCGPGVSRWEHFAHDADIGVRGLAADKEGAFAQVARALTAVIADPDSVAARGSVSIRCEAPNDDLLLFDWLNILVYEMTTRQMLFTRFEVRITDHRLRATAWGEPVDVDRHQPAVEVKGATLTELTVGQDSDGLWRASQMPRCGN